MSPVKAPRYVNPRIAWFGDLYPSGYSAGCVRLWQLFPCLCVYLDVVRNLVTSHHCLLWALSNFCREISRARGQRVQFLTFFALLYLSLLFLLSLFFFSSASFLYISPSHRERRSRSPAPFTAPTFRTAPSLRPDHGIAGKQTNYRFSQVCTWWS